MKTVIITFLTDADQRRFGDQMVSRVRTECPLTAVTRVIKKTFGKNASLHREHIWGCPAMYGQIGHLYDDEAAMTTSRVRIDVE